MGGFCYKSAGPVKMLPSVAIRTVSLMGRLMLGALLVCAGGRAGAQADLFFSHQAWSTEEGLPNASVHQVLQSRVGYLWVATEGGAARFDGSGFSVLRHDTEPAFTSDDVSSIAEDRAGRLWFGTADGLIEQRDNSFRRLGEKDGLPSVQILHLAAAGDGSLLVLTDKGLARLREQTPQPLPPGLPSPPRPPSSRSSIKDTLPPLCVNVPTPLLPTKRSPAFRLVVAPLRL